MSRDLAATMDVARRAARAGGHAALAWFGRSPKTEKKSDNSPVTDADRAAEAAILAVIRDAFPGDAILSEESGASGPDGGYRWVIDPLDGTKSFLRNLPYWGPLVALELKGQPVVGACNLPVLGESYVAARGLGCFDKSGRRLQISTVAAWSEATLSLGELKHLLSPPHQAKITELIRTAQNARCLGDAAGPVQLLRGHADVWIEAGVKIWDLAAHQVLLEEAGGRFTDLQGQPTAGSGHCIAANPALHAAALQILRG